ncbi:MAG: hypothetical protein ACJ8FY_02355 [Gemmataceae bacterium]
MKIFIGKKMYNIFTIKKYSMAAMPSQSSARKGKYTTNSRRSTKAVAFTTFLDCSGID